MNIWANLKTRGLKDILNPKKWLVVISYIYRTYVQGEAAGSVLEKHIYRLRLFLQSGIQLDELYISEQYVYRVLMCSDCLKEGACVDCKCPMPEAMEEASNWCSQNKWQALLDEPDWESFKKALGFEFKLSESGKIYIK